MDTAVIPAAGRSQLASLHGYCWEAACGQEALLHLHGALHPSITHSNWLPGPWAAHGPVDGAEPCHWAPPSLGGAAVLTWWRLPCEGGAPEAFATCYCYSEDDDENSWAVSSWTNSFHLDEDVQVAQGAGF